MNSKPIFLTIGIIAILGIVSITISYGQTALADKGGDPNNSDRAQQNFEERQDKKIDKAIEAINDDNPHNNKGPIKALLNTVNDKGVE
jgi:hypothetical protein